MFLFHSHRPWLNHGCQTRFVMNGQSMGLVVELPVVRETSAHGDLLPETCTLP